MAYPRRLRIEPLALCHVALWLATLVGISRVCIGVHFPTDVLAWLVERSVVDILGIPDPRAIETSTAIVSRSVIERKSSRFFFRP